MTKVCKRKYCQTQGQQAIHHQSVDIARPLVSQSTTERTVPCPAPKGTSSSACRSSSSNLQAVDIQTTQSGYGSVAQKTNKIWPIKIFLKTWKNHEKSKHTECQTRWFTNVFFLLRRLFSLAVSLVSPVIASSPLQPPGDVPPGGYQKLPTKQTNPPTTNQTSNQ